MIRKLSAFLVAWLCLTVHASAGVTCSLPFILTDGTVAFASQVMANYNALVTCLGNAAAAGANSDITSITGLTTPLSVAQGGSSVYLGGTSTGSANAQVVASTTPIGFSLSNKSTIYFIAGFTNTGATQFNINSTGLTNVFRMSPSGPQALTGGEIVTNDLVVAVYDGTQFELVSQHAQFGGFGPITNLASAAPDLGTIPSHNVNITGNTTITSFGSSCSATFPMYQVTFVGALTLTYNAVSLILPAAANITTAANDTATVLCAGANARVLSYTTASGVSLASTINVQSFTGTGTWNRPAGASFSRVVACGAGGGGGGGGRNATSTATNGGAGGGGGYCWDVTYKAADIGASQTVTINTAGTSGSGATVNGNAGTAGGQGGSVTFGSLLTAFGGGGGAGGLATATGVGGGGGGGPSAAGGLGGSTAAVHNGGTSQFGVANLLGFSTTGTTAQPPQFPCLGASGAQWTQATTAAGSAAQGCPFGGAGGGAAGNAVGAGGVGGDTGFQGPGGGAGGGWTTGNVGSAGGNGGRSAGCATATTGGAAGNNPGGSTAASPAYFVGCGGAGGGSSAATAGGAGGAGTNAGGGGGGGAGSAVNGGNGAVGGGGLVIVFSW